jgi:hypothetical protein
MPPFSNPFKNSAEWYFNKYYQFIPLDHLNQFYEDLLILYNSGESKGRRLEILFPSNEDEVGR